MPLDISLTMRIARGATAFIIATGLVAGAAAMCPMGDDQDHSTPYAAEDGAIGPISVSFPASSDLHLSAR